MDRTPSPPKKKYRRGLYIGLGFLCLIVATGLCLLILWASGAIWQTSGTGTDTSTSSAAAEAEPQALHVHTPAPKPTAPVGLWMQGRSQRIERVGGSIEPFYPKLDFPGTPEVEYSVSPNLPRGLSIHPSTGVVTGTPEEPIQATDFIVVCENVAGSDTCRFRLLVDDAIPDFGYADIIQGHRTLEPGRSYSFEPTPTRPNGAKPSRTVWSVDPELEAGLGLQLDTSTGRLYGTAGQEPLEQKMYVLRAENSLGDYQNIALSLGIALERPQPSEVHYTSEWMACQVGVPAEPNYLEFQGCLDRVEVTDGELPAGLYLETNTGDICGTPTEVCDSAEVEVSASFLDGSPLKTRVRFDVADVPPRFHTDADNSVHRLFVGRPVNKITCTITAGGGGRFYLEGEQVPEGLTIDADTGEVGGRVLEEVPEGEGTYEIVYRTRTGGVFHREIPFRVIRDCSYQVRCTGLDATSSVDALAHKVSLAPHITLHREEAESLLRSCRYRGVTLLETSDANEAREAVAAIDSDVVHQLIKTNSRAPRFRYNEITTSVGMPVSVEPEEESYAHGFEFQQEVWGRGSRDSDDIVVSPFDGTVEVSATRAMQVLLYVRGWNSAGDWRTMVNVKVE